MLITWILAGAAVVALLVAVFLVLGQRAGVSAGREPRALDAERVAAEGRAGEGRAGEGRAGEGRAAEGPAAEGPAAAEPPRRAARLPSVDTQSSMEIDIADPAFPDEEEEPTGPTPRILVTAVGQTDAGRRRKHNEDAYLVLPSHSLFAIADGMGGYAAGEVASQMAIDCITTSFQTGQFGGAPIEGLPRRGDELVRAIQSANAAILSQARANEAQAGMGTTLVAARFSPNRNRVYIAHVGDSRLYRMRGDELSQLTTDHTLGAMGISGPSASKLSRAVGVFDEVEVDLSVDEPQRGDFYVLCSDGLSKMVPEPAIAELLRGEGDLDAIVKKLIDEANDRGGKDNVSVILIRVDEPDLSRS